MFGKDKENQSQRGMLAETAVLNRFVELGYEVLIPWVAIMPTISHMSNLEKAACSQVNHLSLFAYR